MPRAAILALPALLLLSSPGRADDLDKPLPAPLEDPRSNAASETVVLAGGCFWGQQGLFEHVKGVTRVVAGYSGGSKATASYPLVSSETTGHAESVQVTFDPRVVTFGRLLQIYFSVAHDPTELNYQGPDQGSSYRSEIFFTSPAQQKTAGAYIAQLTAARLFARPIVTRIEPMTGFYPAEAYHQDYLVRHPDEPYIVYNDLPKLRALRAVWPRDWRPDPLLLAKS